MLDGRNFQFIEHSYVRTSILPVPTYKLLYFIWTPRDCPRARAHLKVKGLWTATRSLGLLSFSKLRVQ